MKGMLLVFQMEIIYHLFRFFEGICDALAKRHHILFTEFEKCDTRGE